MKRLSILLGLVCCDVLAGWTPGAWPATNVSGRTVMGDTNYLAKDAWVLDCYSGLVGRSVMVLGTNIISPKTVRERDIYYSNACSFIILDLSEMCPRFINQSAYPSFPPTVYPTNDWEMWTFTGMFHFVMGQAYTNLDCDGCTCEAGEDMVPFLAQNWRSQYVVWDTIRAAITNLLYVPSDDMGIKKTWTNSAWYIDQSVIWNFEGDGCGNILPGSITNSAFCSFGCDPGFGTNCPSSAFVLPARGEYVDGCSGTSEYFHTSISTYGSYVSYGSGYYIDSTEVLSTNCKVTRGSAVCEKNNGDMEIYYSVKHNTEYPGFYFMYWAGPWVVDNGCDTNEYDIEYVGIAYSNETKEVNGTNYILSTKFDGPGYTSLILQYKNISVNYNDDIEGLVCRCGVENIGVVSTLATYSLAGDTTKETRYILKYDGNYK